MSYILPIYTSASASGIPTRLMDAVSSGSMFYKGVRCTKGHIGVRYVSNSQCVDCMRLAKRIRIDVASMESLSIAEKLMEEKELSESIGEVWDE